MGSVVPPLSRGGVYRAIWKYHRPANRLAGQARRIARRRCAWEGIAELPDFVDDLRGDTRSAYGGAVDHFDWLLVYSRVDHWICGVGDPDGDWRGESEQWPIVSLSVDDADFEVNA